MSDFDIIMAKLNELDSKLSNMPAAMVVPPPEIINSEQICKRLGISEPTLYSWIKRKKVPCIRVGKTLRYNWPSVVQALEKKGGSK